MGSYLSIIILNINGLNASNQKTKTGWMDIKTRPVYMLSTRDPTQTKGHIQTETEGLEKDISCKLRPKEHRSGNTHIRQNRLWNKDSDKRQRGHYIMIKWSIQEDINNYKYICTQHRNTSICKTNAKKYERGN